MTTFIARRNARALYTHENECLRSYFMSSFRVSARQNGSPITQGGFHSGFYVLLQSTAHTHTHTHLRRE